MKHDILGEITRKEGEVIDGVATIRHGTREVKIQMIPDAQSFETTLKLASDVAARLDELDKTARRIIVADLRETYNNGWNEYDEVQADGSLETVSKRQLSEDEFEKKFSLNTVNVTGNEMVELYYDDSGIFWGHSVSVCSFHGMDFSKARAELAG